MRMSRKTKKEVANVVVMTKEVGDDTSTHAVTSVWVNLSKDQLNQKLKLMVEVPGIVKGPTQPKA